MSELKGSRLTVTVSQVQQLSQTSCRKFEKWEKEFKDFIREAEQAEDQYQFSTEALSELERIQDLVKDHEGTLHLTRTRIETYLGNSLDPSCAEGP